MFKKKEDVWDHEIKCLNHTDYELKIVLVAKDTLLMKIFDKSKRKLKKKGLDCDPKIIDKFPIDKKYFSLLKLNIKKVFNITANDIFKNSGGIQLISYDIIDAFFERNKDNDWNINLLLGGQYSDKR